MLHRRARVPSPAIVAIMAAACAACTPASDADRPPAGTSGPPLDATRLEALARHDYPLADSMHACLALDSAVTVQAGAVIAAVRPNARYRCELRDGMGITIALLVDTMEIDFPFITGLRVLDDSPENRDLTAMTAEPPPRGFAFLGTQDMDGDGVRELKLLSFWGATGNTGWSFWRRDTLAGRFVADADLIAMIDPEPLLDAPCLRTWSGGGMAARVYTAVVHCNDSGEWIERWLEHQEWDDGNRFFLRSMSARLPGQDSLVLLHVDTVRDTL